MPDCYANEAAIADLGCRHVKARVSVDRGGQSVSGCVPVSVNETDECEVNRGILLQGGLDVYALRELAGETDVLRDVMPNPAPP